GSLNDYVKDADGDPITYALVNDPGNVLHGQLTVQPDGKLTYVPNAKYQGTDQFTFTATDGRETTTATLSISVENHLPTAQSIPLTTSPHPRKQIYDLAAKGPDSDGDVLRVEIVPPPSRGGVKVLPNGTVEYTPPPLREGPDGFSYKLWDGIGYSNT